MNRPTPTFFMLVPGPWLALSEVTAGLQARGVSLCLDDNAAIKAGEVRVQLLDDNQLGQAFSRGRNGVLDPELVSRIAACKRAALVEVGYVLSDNAIDVARIGRALKELGGLAVRMEASGSASTWDSWIQSLQSDQPSSIYSNTVLLAKGENGVIFTCGMHLFQLPEAQIAMDDGKGAVAWLDALCSYQLDESPALASGHTFRPDLDSERRILERWPDSRHNPNDGRYNPFGTWYLQTPEDSRIKASKLKLTFVPTLTSILFAAERSKSAPLSQSEVEEIVSKGAVIAMEHHDAMALEKSRGYADIEPELAWEQWQIVRNAPA